MSDVAQVGAVIVNYNTRNHAIACVRSVLADGIGTVVVVDNGSSDGSVNAIRTAVPQALVLEQPNRGFGAGANAGIRTLDSEFVMVMNADTVLHPGATKSLLACLDRNETLAAVGPRIENPDGSLYPSARSYPSLLDAVGHGFLGLIAPNNSFSRRYKMLDWDHQTGRTVDWISGACFLARRSALESVAGFDEAYFMYMEDVDLCWRWQKAGLQVAYEPSAVVTHEQGVSTDRHPYRMIVAHHRSLLRYGWRTASPRRRTVFPVVAGGLGLRALLACAHRAVAGRRKRDA